MEDMASASLAVEKGGLFKSALLEVICFLCHWYCPFPPGEDLDVLWKIGLVEKVDISFLIVIPCDGFGFSFKKSHLLCLVMSYTVWRLLRRGWMKKQGKIRQKTGSAGSALLFPTLLQPQRKPSVSAL